MSVDSMNKQHGDPDTVELEADSVEETTTRGVLWSPIFVMEVSFEKMMERLNSGESKTIFRNSSCIVLIGLTTSARKAWQVEEETTKDTSIVLIRQEQSCTSELFQVIQDAVSLILLLDKTHKDPESTDFGAPRHAQHMHKAWKKFQITVCWVGIKIDLKKELKFFQTRSNAIILHETLPVFCIPKVVRMETGEVIFERFLRHLGYVQRFHSNITG